MVRDNRELKAKLNIIGQLQLTTDGTLKESLWILVLEVESLKIFGVFLLLHFLIKWTSLIFVSSCRPEFLLGFHFPFLYLYLSRPAYRPMTISGGTIHLHASCAPTKPAAKSCLVRTRGGRGTRRRLLFRAFGEMAANTTH